MIRKFNRSFFLFTMSGLSPAPSLAFMVQRMGFRLYVERGRETFHSVHVEAAERVAAQARRSRRRTPRARFRNRFRRCVALAQAAARATQRRNLFLKRARGVRRRLDVLERLHVRRPRHARNGEPLPSHAST